MLKQINITNFAIIKQTSIDFENGLTIITGQTGAGKSIVIDAIMQLLGAKANNKIIFNNEDSAIIEGIFDINDDIKNFLQEHDLSIDDDYLIIKKIIKKDGKSQIKLNERIISSELIKKLAPLLLEIHSQSANLDLLNNDVQQAYVDSFFNQEQALIYQEYQQLYQDYLKLKQKIKKIEQEKVDEELLPYYQDQLNFINNNFLDDKQLLDLENQERNFQEYEKNYLLLENILGLFENNQLLSSINEIENNLEKIQSQDNKYNEMIDKINENYYSLLEIKDSITAEYESIYFDEVEFNEIKEKIHNYQKLMKKYSYSPNLVMEKISELENNIDLIINGEKLMLDLNKEKEKIKVELIKKANQLTIIRENIIAELESKITQQLKSLHLSDAQFKIALEETNLSQIGHNQVVFYFNANKGGHLLPLSQVASGGELSRLALILKALNLDNNKMYIFDEVDTGVSGVVAEAIGKMMKSIAQNNDLITITHLPQVAVYADNHLFIEKNNQDAITTSNCYYLDDSQQINEIAQMISGENISENAIKQAKDLISNAKI